MNPHHAKQFLSFCVSLLAILWAFIWILLVGSLLRGEQLGNEERLWL